MADICRPHARCLPLLGILLLLGVLAYGNLSRAQQPSGERGEHARRLSHEAEDRGLAEPFQGVTTDGTVVPGLFPIRATGVSTAPVRQAAEAFLATLTPEQRAKTVFTVDDSEWRKWMNQHFYIRQGTGFKAMTEA